MAFLVLHGIGHIIWFMAAWTSTKAGIKDGPWLLPGGFTIDSVVGRAFGLMALSALVLFVLAGLGLAVGAIWWRPLAQIAAYISLVAIFPWARQSPRGNTLNALLADLAVLLLVTLPVSVEFLSTV